MPKNVDANRAAHERVCGDVAVCRSAVGD